jgi:hypothetical protein
VYERIAGGWGRERRYIYWNAHYYGENFYGWSIGDEKSLFESGPFHSQGKHVVQILYRVGNVPVPV